MVSGRGARLAVAHPGLGPGVEHRLARKMAQATHSRRCADGPRIEGSAVAPAVAVETVAPSPTGRTEVSPTSWRGHLRESVGEPIMEQRGKRRPVHTPTLQGWVDLVFEDHHPSSQRHPPYDVEAAALQEWGFTYNRTRDEDRDALLRVSWTWPTACAWIAWRTFEGAASGVAAFRAWRGRIWREGVFDARPGRLGLLSAAELDLCNVLEAGKVSAEGVQDSDVVAISAGEWSRLAWEVNQHNEVIEFDRLLMLGAPRYEGVTLPRATIMRLWPSLDGWAPDGAVGTVEDAPTPIAEPIDVTFREMAEDVVADNLPLLTPPPTKQERLNAIAREMPAGLQWKKGGSKKTAESAQYEFYLALEGASGERVSRDGEAWEAWRDHYPYKRKAGRPRRADQK